MQHAFVDFVAFCKSSPPLVYALPTRCSRSWQFILSLAKGFVTGPQGCGRFVLCKVPRLSYANRLRCILSVNYSRYGSCAAGSCKT